MNWTKTIKRTKKEVEYEPELSEEILAAGYIIASFILNRNVTPSPRRGKK